MSRVMILWCPDFSVAAALAEADLPRSVPAAVLHGHHIAVCNSAARSGGVRRGMRRRDAQSRQPRLHLLQENPARDARVFEEIVAAVEERRPGVMPLRPGLLAIRAPGRWSARRPQQDGGHQAGERDAAAELAQVVVDTGLWDVRVGVADDLFTAEHAARSADVQDQRIVPPGGSAAFLRRLPVEVLATETDDPREAPQLLEMISLLRRLGLFRLGDLAALPAAEVGQRFGPLGARVRAQVNGADVRGVCGRTPPPELDAAVEFEPPLDSVEAICFSSRVTAEGFIGTLAAHALVGTQVRIEALAQGVGGAMAVVSARSWLHPRHFTARDLIDRVHWQLHGQRTGAVRSRRVRQGGLTTAITEPISGLRFRPEIVEPAGEHAATLWGGGAEELVQRGMAKVQAMLGYEAVLVPSLQGGRSPKARQGLTPWGEPAEPSATRPVDRPWPGRISGPAPARVFTQPRPSALRDAGGAEVSVGLRGEPSAAPARLLLPDDRSEDRWLAVADWAGPWPLDERWWEHGDDLTGSAGRRPATFRMQVVDEDGHAWLLRYLNRWWLEAGYD